VKSHSLLELSQSIERVISHTFQSAYWVRAEISRLNFYPKSGHCYPELVEKQHGKIVSEIRSTIWRNTFQQITSKFKTETGEDLKEGMKILFQVQVKYSPTHGISLNVLDIEPSFTIGEMAKEKKNTIETLKKENVFDYNHQLPFPYFPSKIAIISVSTSKGYHDFLTTIYSKAARFNIDMELFPAILQGDTAVNSITEQLEIIQEQHTKFDIVLIIRGGGGDVGLHCYNHLKMARTVATFPIPVISGIGHSTNETVVEMVAHTNKITPTAVADTLVERFKDLELQWQQALQTITQIPKTIIKPHQQKLIDTTRSLKSSATIPLHNEKIRVQQIISDLNTSVQLQLSKEKSNISLNIIPKLKYLNQNRISSSNKHLDHLESKLQILDPKSILKRGFSLTMINNKSVQNIQQLKAGDSIKTVFHDGSIESEITKTSTHE
jgi:exodeoxyribonuclease VII large subunit